MRFIVGNAERKLPRDGLIVLNALARQFHKCLLTALFGSGYATLCFDDSAPGLDFAEVLRPESQQK